MFRSKHPNPVVRSEPSEGCAKTRDIDTQGRVMPQPAAVITDKLHRKGLRQIGREKAEQGQDSIWILGVCNNILLVIVEPRPAACQPRPVCPERPSSHICRVEPTG